MDFVDGTNSCEQCVVISNKLCFNLKYGKEETRKMGSYQHTSLAKTKFDQRRRNIEKNN